MPRAEKSTMELKKDLDKIRERYERSLEKDNRKIADLVRKHFGDEPDLEKLDAVFGKMANGFANTAASGMGSNAGKVQTATKKEDISSEQSVPEDGDGENDE